MADKTLATSAFAQLCPGIATVAQDGFVYIRISTDKTKGRPSASGKMVLTGSTPGGFMEVPDTGGLRMNLSAGFSVPKGERPA